MNDFLENLPPVGKMFKLVMILLLAVIAVGLVVAIVKMLLPLLFLAAILAGGVWLYNRMKTNGSPA